MRLVFATGNPHKVVEVQSILAPLDIEVDSLTEFDDPPPEPVEDGKTFAENARLKARYYARELGIPCLAEDSGLAVDALDGDPGVYSARYAGTEGTRDERDAANNAKLLRRLAGVPPERRQARFVSAIAVATPDGAVIAEALGICEGLIADAPRGENGFGYDPLFFLADRDCTNAELTPEEKNARSHRGQALRGLAARLSELTRAEGALGQP